MKRNGFTLIEMFIAIFVLCTIVVIALPMHAVRAKKSELMHAKAQLMTIKASENKFKMEHGMYTMNTTKLANWKTGTKRYRYLPF
jgi:prepilin-type N-terminal cleavage/methylation domain-containing protein